MHVVEFMTSSDEYDYGCDGGIPVYAYYYVYVAGGLQSNSTYPYTSYFADDSMKCDANTKEFQV